MNNLGIRKKHHYLADYSYVPVVLAAPVLGCFEQNRLAANVCRTFAVAALAVSLCTKAKWGVWKIIPYKLHAGIDIASGVLALAACTIPAIRKDKAAKNTFILMGLTGLLVGGLSFLGAKKATGKLL